MQTTTTSEDAIRHSVVRTDIGYESLVQAFERVLQHLDPETTQSLVERKAPWSEVEREIGAVGGSLGLMIISRLDLGRVASLSGRATRCCLYLVGNPVIAEQIVRVDVRGAFYVPFRVAIYDDGDPNGASIAYDRPSSFLATLGRPELMAIAEDLDRKIDAAVAAVKAA